MPRAHAKSLMAASPFRSMAGVGLDRRTPRCGKPCRRPSASSHCEAVRPHRIGGFRPRYEHAPIHLLTTAALRSLSRELPGSVIDTRRFRPNILVDWPDEDEAMPEKDWIDREIRMGEVVLRGERPCGRCGFITIEQDRLPVDVEILRRVVQRHGRDFGIYCDVVFPGHVTTDAMVTVA